jgi:hypothetical protein
VKGTATAKAATSRVILNLLHLHEKRLQRLSCVPLAPQQAPEGCMVLAPHLWMVVYPRKFWPHQSEKYDGMVNPTEFL